MARQYMYFVHQFILLFMFAVTFQTDFVSRYASAQPTIEDLEEAFKNSSQGQEVCVFNALLCRRGEEYCSSNARSCRPLFPWNVTTDTAKRDYCMEKVNNTATEPSVHSNCIYFIGTTETKRAGCAKPLSESDLQNQHYVHDIGKEFCPYNNLYCRLGRECCNATTRQCEPLFPDNASDKDKREWCQEVFNKNLTMYHDSCIFIFGYLHCHKNIINDEPTKDWSTSEIITVAGVLLLLVIIVMGTVITVMVLRQKKLACFKQDTQNTQPQDPCPEAKPLADDVRVTQKMDAKRLLDAGKQDDAEPSISPE